VARIPDWGVVPSREGSAALVAREVVLRAKGTSGATRSLSRLVRFPHGKDAQAWETRSPASGKRFARPFVRAGEGRMSERACPCVASGCRSRRAAPDRHDASRPRSERVDDGLATHPLPISRAPKGRGDKDGGSGPSQRGGDAGGETDAGSVPGMHLRSRTPRAARHSRGWIAVRVPRPAGPGLEKWSSSTEGVSGRGSRVAVTRGSVEAALVPSGPCDVQGESDSSDAQGTRVDDSEASEARSKGNGRKKTPPESSWARRSGSIVVKTIDSSILVAPVPERGPQRRGARGSRSSSAHGRQSRRDPARHGCTIEMVWMAEVGATHPERRRREGRKTGSAGGIAKIETTQRRRAGPR